MIRNVKPAKHSLCSLLEMKRLKARSKATFGRALRDVMEHKGISFPKLSAITKSVDETDKGLSQAYLSELAHDRQSPRPERVVLIARSLGVEPEYFREYREHVLSQRVQAISVEVDYDKVLAALEALAHPPKED